MQLGQRLRSGIQIVGDMTSTYEIRQFAVQTDQVGIRFPWAVSTTIPRDARRRTPLSMNQVADGKRECLFTFKALTFDMLDFMATNYTGETSGIVTVMVFNRADVAVFMTGVLYWPENLPQFPLGVGVSSPIVFPFRKGVVIT